LDIIPTIVAALSFGAVAALVIVTGQYYIAYVQLQRRLPAPIPSASSNPFMVAPPAGLPRFIARFIADKQIGGDQANRGKLRRELLRAGYFGAEAVNIYIVARIASALLSPILAYVFIATAAGQFSWLFKGAFVAVVAMIGVAAPGAYISRRQRQLAQQFRLVFPDLLDLLVVCVDAGLGLDAAFDRVRPEIAKRSRELGQNLELMSAEIRAGRSMTEGLESLAERLGLEEAGSLVGMLRQSIELGSDVADALRVFSDEMREKRLLRAEEAANKLTVKMVLPLGLFIFPVVLLVVMLPVMIKLVGVLGKG
jgi:tight adherence protein C